MEKVRFRFFRTNKAKKVEYKRSLIAIINKEAEKNWKASAWILEHKYRDEYATISSVGKCSV